MSDLYWLWAFMHSFFTTVVITCAHPTNWDNCFPVHEWMVPWIHDVVHMHENGAYHAEKCTLQQYNDLGLDERDSNSRGRIVN